MNHSGGRGYQPFPLKINLKAILRIKQLIITFATRFEKPAKRN